ncbi:MAG: hypothetical protein N2544_16330 [Burkholderiales bacterium]|nr:hypothetical protein [Burkholderiales bacterium]
MSRTVRAAVLALLVALAAPAAADDMTLETYLQLLRSDLRSYKTKIIAEGMDLSEADAKGFWPVYREYEVELAAIGDERVELLKEYAKAFATMTDAKAEDITRRGFALDQRRTELKARYFDRFERATSARTAARFFQIEAQVDALQYIRVAAEIPFFPKPGNSAPPPR